MTFCTQFETPNRNRRRHRASSFARVGISINHSREYAGRREALCTHCADRQSANGAGKAARFDIDPGGTIANTPSNVPQESPPLHTSVGCGSHDAACAHRVDHGRQSPPWLDVRVCRTAGAIGKAPWRREPRQRVSKHREPRRRWQSASPTRGVQLVGTPDQPRVRALHANLDDGFPGRPWARDAPGRGHPIVEIRCGSRLEGQQCSDHPTRSAAAAAPRSSSLLLEPELTT